MQTSPLINVMVTAARKAGRTLARDFGEVENLQVSRKGPADFVSSADLKAEKTLFEELSKARPGYGFLMEERGAVEGTDKTNRFINDPLDGTTNFLHGIPHFAISIGLEREGILVAGVIYNVIRDELFWAEKGAGAYLNDRRLRVAGRNDMRDALFATGAQRHSISLTSPQAASTATGNVASMCGMSPPAPCLCAKRAAWSPSPM